ncbi:MAG: FG-GAP-like repeat-containing protein [Aureispira sp.]
MRNCIVLLLGFLPWIGYAQPTALEWRVERSNATPYLNPWTGGLNNPQFSVLDLDGDGIQDLVYFDKIGEMVTPFLNNGTANTVDYTYAPEYAGHFPVLKGWMLLRDYNCDGVQDIFAHDYDSNTGRVSIAVYQGLRDSQNKITFPNLTKRLSYKQRRGTQQHNLFNSSADLPAIDDIDGDGDLDILNFSSSGGFVDLFLNDSQERGWGCDSLRYTLVDNCWGRFYESGVTEAIDFSHRFDSCPNNASWVPPSRRARHSGSTILTLDRDNDGDKEVLLGDISFNNITLLTNGGNKDTAMMTAQELFFPMNSVPIKLEVFPAAFYLDVNNDGAKDILSAPNILGNAKDKEAWYYKNTGTATLPVWEYEQDDFLVGDMLDFGTGAAPLFWDYNNDGLVDILVGNEQYYLGQNQWESSLYLLENVGTAAQPSYRLVDKDFGNMRQYGQTRLVPTIGDLNNDGLMDLILGLSDGQLLQFTNQGTVSAPAFPAFNAHYQGIDVGHNASPQLVDVNRDGLLDLLVGERNGNTNYFENIGTANSPLFSVTATTETFGFIDAKLPGSLDGNSAPHLVDIGGAYRLFMGNEVGQLWQYDNIDGNILGAFNRINGPLDSLDVGAESHVTIGRSSSATSLVLLLGNKRGGLQVYSAQSILSQKRLEITKNGLVLAPNPTQDLVQVTLKQPLEEDGQLLLYNSLGQLLEQQKWRVNESKTLSLGHLPKGTYVLQVVTSKGNYVQLINRL